MGFRSGRAAWQRFRVKSAPQLTDTELFAKLSEAVVPESFDVAPPDTIAGWSGGRHLLDRTFDADNLFGDAVLMGFRLDAFKLPADLRRAWQLQNEEALGAAEPGSSKSAIRKAAREEVDDRARREMTSGLHRSSRMFPVLWDRGGGVLLASTPSDAARTALVDLARLTLDLELEPESAGVFAESFAASQGILRDLEDATPTSFGPPPRGHEGGQVPSVGWGRAPHPHDFLGAEFLLDLWCRAERGAEDEVEAAITEALDMRCAWEAGGDQGLRSTTPARSPEARRGLKNGKWPRKAGLMIASGLEHWTLILDGVRFAPNSVRLPEPAERPETEREGLEARVDAFLSCDRALTNLYRGFLERRLDAGRWASESAAIKRWISADGQSSSFEIEVPREASASLEAKQD